MYIAGRFAIAGAKVRISTDYLPWKEYLDMHFGKLLTPDSRDDVDIDINGLWLNELWGSRPLRAERTERFPDRVGGSIVRSENEICWVQKLRGRRLRIIATWQKNRFLVESLFQRKVIKDVTKELLGSSGSLRLFELTYQLVYYPAWYYLETAKGVHFLHGSAVRLGDSAVVFAGLEGIGKTTLALAFLGYDGELISDNILCYTETGVVTMPEPIRLHSTALPFMSRLSLRKIRMGKAQKGFYELGNACLDEATAVKAVFLPVCGDRTEIIPISAEQCAHFILAANHLTGEIGGYQPFVSCMSMLRPDAAIDSSRREKLVKLLSGARSAILRVKRDGDIETLAHTILSWLEGT
ncbi:MAG: hypothetical protein JW844_04185 [Candidatus Omnitrophica bacterium]|nr:hypothetical protein [Candidatus Omnitrophota bacterium]